MNSYAFNLYLPKKNFRPNVSIPNTAKILLGMAAATVINDSRKTPLSILSEHKSTCECDPVFTTNSVTYPNKKEKSNGCYNLSVSCPR